jgi:mannose-6-phosphate isomerase
MVIMIKKIEKPWGHEIILAHTNSYVMKKMLINPGQRMSLQYHEKKEETIYVHSSGPLVLWTTDDDSDFKILQCGESVHIKPGDVHRFGATENDSCILIECSTTELDDVVRLRDDYER